MYGWHPTGAGGCASPLPALLERRPPRSISGLSVSHTLPLPPYSSMSAYTRPRGRKADELRDISIVYERLDRVDGSARFGFGESVRRARPRPSSHHPSPFPPSILPSFLLPFDLTNIGHVPQFNPHRVVQVPHRLRFFLQRILQKILAQNMGCPNDSV